MRAWHISAAGSLDNLALHDEPAPTAAAGQVVVRIRAVSLNYRDLMMVFGPQPYGPQPGIIPGSDGAGEVIAIGEGVGNFAVGDRVVLPFRPGWLDGPLDAASIMTDLGGAVDGVLAEQVAIAASALVPIPDSMSFEAAATLPCAGVTAWSAIHRGKAVGPGNTVLILGTGGVSVFALQIARAFGARVIATTSSADKAARLTELGADAVINYRSEPEWDTRVRELTGGCGADRIVEVGGAGTLPRSMACLAPEGEIALIGLLDNPGNTISPLPLMSTMGVLRGISVGSRADLVGLTAMASSQFAPVIDSVFDFADAHAAILHLQSQRHFGKVVIRV